jgi:hypothetical protein
MERQAFRSAYTFRSSVGPRSGKYVISASFRAQLRRPHIVEVFLKRIGVGYSAKARAGDLTDSRLLQSSLTTTTRKQNENCPHIACAVCSGATDTRNTAGGQCVYLAPSD